MPYDKAVAAGAIALFGEKYEKDVRVLASATSRWSSAAARTCARSGDIGLFKIVSEGGVAAGVRRIEAVTGEGALEYVEHTDQLLKEVAGLVRGSREDVSAKVRDALERIRQLEKENRDLKNKLASGQGTDLSAGAVRCAGVKVVAAQVDGADAGALRNAVDQLKDKLKSAVIVLASVDATNKITLVAGVTADQTNKVKAGESSATWPVRWWQGRRDVPGLRAGRWQQSRGTRAALASVEASYAPNSAHKWGYIPRFLAKRGRTSPATRRKLTNVFRESAVVPQVVERLPGLGGTRQLVRRHHPLFIFARGQPVPDCERHGDARQTAEQGSEERDFAAQIAAEPRPPTPLVRTFSSGQVPRAARSWLLFGRVDFDLHAAVLRLVVRVVFVGRHIPAIPGGRELLRVEIGKLLEDCGPDGSSPDDCERSLTSDIGHGPAKRRIGVAFDHDLRPAKLGHQPGDFVQHQVDTGVIQFFDRLARLPGA